MATYYDPDDDAPTHNCSPMAALSRRATAAAVDDHDRCTVLTEFDRELAHTHQATLTEAVRR